MLSQTFSWEGVNVLDKKIQEILWEKNHVRQIASKAAPVEKNDE